ncbi:hypothetical protein B0H63DRAFT_475101 [Podospora didyma]|uniref:Infection structure specific protein n=1 Tax=Podospora didyma TaxID=330526 RepID=A0AAE0TVM6_9PEZI|nr:hypothetical protein B0H63DRAFT_475101 [Podospora didyma]
MYTFSLLATTIALAASVSALAQPAVTPPPAAAVVARATSTAPDFCTTTMASMILDFPLPTNSDLANFVQTAELPLASVAAIVRANPKVGEDDLFCSSAGLLAKVTPPASLSSEYAVYSKSVDAWYASWSPIVSSVSPKCGREFGAGLEFLVAKDTNQCKAALKKFNAGERTAPRLVAVGAAVAAVAVALAAL